jgi:hypothetical protein
VLEGESVQFSVSATGSAALSYQWSRNGTAISGATSSSYSIASVQESDAGTYSVRVSDGNTEATASATLSVTVLDPVEIATGPQSQLVMQGDSVQFSVSATGTGPLSYQWSYNGTPISGATSSSYSIASAQVDDAGTYSVLVGNGHTQASASATLAVEVPVVDVDIELNWSMPDQREDGSALSEQEIAGYVIAWGTSSSALTETLNISGAGSLSTVIADLELGTYYFAIATVDADGMQGGFSEVISVSAM